MLGPVSLGMATICCRGFGRAGTRLIAARLSGSGCGDYIPGCTAADRREMLVKGVLEAGAMVTVVST